ncbi:MAG: RidA family protein [Thermoanaerobaculia bacterium]|nr:RidA family protein [Thermoanaerobaculia bacterium]
METIDPPGWSAPRGYSNGVLAPAGAQILFVAGQIGWDGEQRLVSDDLVAQFEQALRNVLAVVSAADGWPDQITRMTIYVDDRQAYLDATREIGAVYRQLMGTHYPAMSLVEVSALLESGARVEIEATAAIF